VKEEKSDNLEAFSCRLEREQISFIEDLTARRVLGSNKNVVLRALISFDESEEFD